MSSLKDIRGKFLEYFRSNDHAVVPSSSLVPRNDPTLMFTSAGMVQFKNVFTGQEKRTPPRAATAQKCVRAGGKHNDLDRVGYTARHHTFFEMLGNFSFGDYFKERAIELAWNLITKVFGLKKDRLLATVYATDEEAFSLWKKIAGLPESRIIRIATSDNFWSMGDVGPCGPCTEIFYDHGDHIPGGPPGSPNEDGDRFIEIWNLVFMQYEQQVGGARVNLPRPSVDTGMGLERITAVMQGVHDNYDIDLFRHLIAASAEASGSPVAGPHAVSHRVIADHLRASCFLIADGVLPSNEGRGYVLRRIMRRAMRHAHILGSKDPLMYRLVPALVAAMGEAYPELKRAEALTAETLKLEEARFRDTLARGLKLLDEEERKIEDRLPDQLDNLPLSEKSTIIANLPDLEVKDAIVRAGIVEIAKVASSASQSLRDVQPAIETIRTFLNSSVFDQIRRVLNNPVLEQSLSTLAGPNLEVVQRLHSQLERLQEQARPALSQWTEGQNNISQLVQPEMLNKLQSAIDKANIALVSTSAEQIKKAITETALKDLRETVSKLPTKHLNAALGNTLAGETAFKLHDTYGFPRDLTEDALRERGLRIDGEGFDAAMARQKAEARKAWAGSGEAATDTLWFALREELGATEFLGYETEISEGVIGAIVKDGARVDSASAGDTVLILTNQTPFYGEGGGQAGDIGAMFSGKGAEGTVTDTEKKLGNLHVHVVKVTRGTVSVGDAVELRVDSEKRRATRANHSATHLLHSALKHVLGPHVAQKGSHVGPERLRFDFSHPKAVTAEELSRVEDEVNLVLRQNNDVSTRLMPTSAAIEAGAIAMFGEKYGDEVRVLSMGSDLKGAAKPYSVELCGGTHVRRLGDIGLFTILAESAVAAGVRRIEALTSEGARRYLESEADAARAAASVFKTGTHELAQRITALMEERRRLERELSEAKRTIAMSVTEKVRSRDEIDATVHRGGQRIVGGINTILRVVDGIAPKDLKLLADDAKRDIGSGVVAFVTAADGKASLVAGVTQDLIARVSAVDLVRAGVEALGGKGGGGRPDMAQGGGPDTAKMEAALDAIAARLAALQPA